jgi:hypothetical protein
LAIHANVFDTSTYHLSPVIQPFCKSLGAALSKDYGGPMEHLWIDIELNPGHADRRPPFAFRFQKRVSSNHFGLPAVEESRNVGHYSVRPNYVDLAAVPKERVGCYLMQMVFASTVVLEEKQKRLGGFDAVTFRSDFRAELWKLGCKGIAEA